MNVRRPVILDVDDARPCSVGHEVPVDSRPSCTLSYCENIPAISNFGLEESLSDSTVVIMWSKGAMSRTYHEPLFTDNAFHGLSHEQSK